MESIQVVKCYKLSKSQARPRKGENWMGLAMNSGSSVGF